MEKEKFISILRELRSVCDDVNNESQGNIVYEVLQLSYLAKRWNIVHAIANFYDSQWTGNNDFMHIPNIEQTLQNCKDYPIIIAREKDSSEILGISTVKYDENTSGHTDPYFPYEDAKYFSITGILTRKNNQHKGIGRKIYEIAIRGAHNYEKYYPGTRMMCVIDCRNKQSLEGLAKAVENLNASKVIGQGVELPANVVGYYELRSKDTQELVEAPTLVLEVGLDEISSEMPPIPRTIKYEHNNGNTLYESLLIQLRNRLQKYGIEEPIITEDTECGMLVHYTSIKAHEQCHIRGITIDPNGTEKNNDRVPKGDVDEFIGPMPLIEIDLDEDFVHE